MIYDDVSGLKASARRFDQHFGHIPFRAAAYSCPRTNNHEFSITLRTYLEVLIELESLRMIESSENNLIELLIVALFCE